MKTSFIRFFPILLTVMLLSFGGFVAAQNQATCSAVATQALTVAEQVCTGLGRNSACYGHETVDATFTEPQPVAFFSQPGDLTSTTILETITTSPLNTLLDEWGIALLNVQANIPNTLPGQNVTFLLLGDVKVNNAVDPENVFMGGEPVQVVTTAATPLRLNPSERSSSTSDTPVPTGTTLLADAVSADGNWYRVTDAAGEEDFGWIMQEALRIPSTARALPVYQPNESRSPMQAFYLRVGLGQTSCTQVPNALLVRSPQDAQVEFTVNGANIRLGSTAILRTRPATPDEAATFGGNAGDVLEVTVFDGEAVINPDSDNPIVVAPGQTVYAPLTEVQPSTDGEEALQEVSEGGVWSVPAPANLSSYAPLEGVTLGTILSYPIQLPETTDAPEVTAEASAPLDALTPAMTGTITATATPSVTGTLTTTPSASASGTITAVGTQSATPTTTPTGTLTVTGTPPSTATGSRTVTRTPTRTRTATPAASGGAGADIALSAAVSVSTVALGDQVAYTVEVTNRGPNSADVQIGDLLPTGLTLVEFTPSSGTYDPGADLWQVSALARNASASIRFIVALPVALDTLVFTGLPQVVDSSQPDPNLNNNVATITINVEGGGEATAEVTLTPLR